MSSYVFQKGERKVSSENIHSVRNKADGEALGMTGDILAHVTMYRFTEALR